jgi:hypothetical protein
VFEEMAYSDAEVNNFAGNINFLGGNSNSFADLFILHIIQR